MLRTGNHAQGFFAEAVKEQFFGAGTCGNSSQHDVQLILQQRLYQHIAGIDLDAHGQARVAFFQGGDGAGQQP
ncbi:hypothetical protein D3C71_2024070 [compost metagenome]